MGRTVTNVYVITSFAALGGGLFGFDISSMSGVLGTEAYKQYFNNPQGSRQGGITAAMPAGSLLGALISSYLGDYFGRKVAIQIASIIWIIGSIFQTASQNVGMLVFGRIVAGICVGIASSIVPVYQSEIAQKEIRGRVVSLQQWAITWGILIQYFIQYGASFTGGGANNVNQKPMAFRIPWGVQMVPAFILFVGLFWFPYSPRWLASKDRWEEALQVLADVHGGGDVNNPVVLAEYKEIEEAIKFQREQEVSDYRELIKPRILKRVVLGMSLQAWSQLCGMNVMMYYIVYVMQGAGIANPLLTSSIQYIINVAMTVPAIIWIDKLGRRPALLAGSFLMMSWLFISGAIQGAFGEPETDRTQPITWKLVDKPSQAKAIVACSYLFVATFATTWGPISWTMPSEVYPQQVRAKAVSLATACNKLGKKLFSPTVCYAILTSPTAWNTALAFAVPPLLRSISWKMYMIFGTFNGAAFIHMFLTAPETKGRTLEEMDVVFDSGIPAWRTVPKGSRLEELKRDIEAGNLKVNVGSKTTEVQEEKL